MARRAWPVLKSCDHKRHKAIVDSPNDWLTQLPDEILVSIMSHLTMKEAARISLVSPEWKEQLWQHYPFLNFEDSKAMKKISNYKLRDKPLIREERDCFVSRVDHIVEQHLGAVIEEFRVNFDLDCSYKTHIDNWVFFALTKQVKRLELNLETLCHRKGCYTFVAANIGTKIKPALTSLSLQEVNISGQAVECILQSFPFLEKLCISCSEKLTSIRASSVSSLPLKHLHVTLCWKLKIIDLSAPKLLSFRYVGCRIQLHIKNASSLSEVSIGGWRKDRPITYAFDSLANYFFQLEYLELHISLHAKGNLEIKHSPALTNLKHLGLNVDAYCDHSLLGWTPMIEASPILQKLILELNTVTGESRMIVKRNGLPLKCLKTLEIVGFVGRPIDEEFITYVLDNAIMLQEVVINVKGQYSLKSEERKAVKRAMKLERELPDGVKLKLICK